MMKYDIYLAGPFFNEAQKGVMSSVKRMIVTEGLRVCDPQDLSPVIVDLPPEERTPALFAEIFRKNVEGIDQSWAVLAWTGVKDTGTAFELGYAYSRSLLLQPAPHSFTFAFEGEKPNVMLAQSTNGHIPSLFAMVKFLRALKAELVDVARGRKRDLRDLRVAQAIAGE